MRIRGLFRSRIRSPPAALAACPETLAGDSSSGACALRVRRARDDRFLAVLPQSALDPEQQRAERRAIARRHDEAAVTREIIGIDERDLVRLVPHQDARLLAETEVSEDALDGADLLIAIGIARNDAVDEEVRVLFFLERRAERRDQLHRKVADETDGVGDDHLALVRKAQAPADRIQRREQLVRCERIATALGARRDRVQQRRLAGVRVAADRDDRQVAALALLAAKPALVREVAEPLLEQVAPIARATPVDLELRLAGAAAADAAGQARHHRVLLDQAGQGVAQLRELDLELAVSARRVLREDVENQHRSIEDLELGRLADRARLARRQIGIEDHDLGAELHRAQEDLVELAAADEEFRIGLRPALDEDVEHLDARGPAQLAELRDPRFGVARAAELDMDEQRAILADVRGRDAMRTAELLLELGDQLEEVRARCSRGLRRQLHRRASRRFVFV